MTRRNLLRASAAGLLASSRAVGANDRIRVALIGAGGRGRSVSRWAAEAPNAQLVGVADVNPERSDLARERFGSALKVYKDYRGALDDDSIDGVIVATPDHWHVPMTLAAVDAGKDVYCEKPVTQRVEEGAELLAGVGKTDRVVATGTQQRSWDHYVRAKRLINEGELGQVSFVRMYWYQNYLTSRRFEAIDASKIDWRTWLGTRSEQPFDAMKYRRWRFFWEFGGGIFTDLMTHWIDVAQWVLDASSPKLVHATGLTHRTDWLETPDTVTATLHYEQGFTVLYHSAMNGSLDGGGIVFRGDRASMKLTRDGFEIYPEGVVAAENTRMPEPTIRFRSTGDGTKTNVENWLDCMRSRRTPNANLKAGVEAARTSHLANLAMREARIVEG